jgi:hypothetical protein
LILKSVPGATISHATRGRLHVREPAFTGDARVYYAAQDLEQTRRTLNFIDDDETIAASTQIPRGVIELCQVRRVFQVQVIECAIRTCRPGKQVGQGRLARLTRSKQSHGRKLSQVVLHMWC